MRSSLLRVRGNVKAMRREFACRMRGASTSYVPLAKGDAANARRS
jgi:hypothetical protein